MISFRSQSTRFGLNVLLHPLKEKIKPIEKKKKKPNPDGDYDWSSTFMSTDIGKDRGKSSTTSSPMTTVDKSFQVTSTFSNINTTPKSKTDSASTSSFIDFQGSGDEDFPF